MAAFVKVESEEDGTFTASSILALAGEMKRRKVSRNAKVQVLMHLKGDRLEMRVPVNGVRKLAIQPEQTPTKMPTRRTKRKKA